MCILFPELSDIRQGVMNGDYDESPDDEDNKKLAEEFPFMNNLFKKN